MNRPILRPYPLAEALQFRPGTVVMTMSRGQWDATLAGGYEAGHILLELDDNEQPLRAYRRERTDPSPN